MFDHAMGLPRDNRGSLRGPSSRLNFVARCLLASAFLFAVFTIVGLLTGSVAHAAEGCPGPAGSVGISLVREACAAVEKLSSAGTRSGLEQSAEGDAIGGAIRAVRSASGHRTDLVNVAEAVDSVDSVVDEVAVPVRMDVVASSISTAQSVLTGESESVSASGGATVAAKEHREIRRTIDAPRNTPEFRDASTVCANGSQAAASDCEHGLRPTAQVERPKRASNRNAPPVSPVRSETPAVAGGGGDGPLGGIGPDGKGKDTPFRVSEAVLNSDFRLLHHANVPGISPD